MLPRSEMASTNSDFLLTLGSGLVEISVGGSEKCDDQKVVHHFIYKKLLEKMLPRFLDLYLKEESPNTVILRDLEPHVFGVLIKWLFNAGTELEYESAFGLIGLYGFAESLGENSLMDDVMTALYSKYERNTGKTQPDLYAYTYKHTKPGSKLRDFHVSLFAWELLGSVHGWQQYKEISGNIKDLSDDLWPTLAKMSLDSSLYIQGVCRFHVHSEEAKETCPGAWRFPEQYSFTPYGSFAGSAGYGSQHTWRSTSQTRSVSPYLDNWASRQGYTQPARFRGCSPRVRSPCPHSDNWVPSSHSPPDHASGTRGGLAE